ncbi:MAG: hypothetical protein R2849_08460 [Thermomicrobiales bacterium]
MTTDIEQSSITSMIRRMLRILGAMPAYVGDPESVERAARFSSTTGWLAAVRRQAGTVDGYSPLVVAGDGPILLTTYMDDADPFASSQPPSFRDTAVSGPGILRKTGVVAAAAAELDPERGGRFTLIVETDRNSGSQTLERWLGSDSHRYGSIWKLPTSPFPRL